MFDGISTWDWVLIIAAFCGSGLMRGFNGGVGANFLTAPVLAAILGPREAVPIVLAMNFLSSFQLIPAALPHVNWRETLPIGITCALCVPIGAWALFSVDEDLMRRAIAGTAVILCLMLLSGWRYRGPRTIPVSATVGATSGLIGGAVSMGGPPVFIYHLSGTATGVQARANFIGYAVMLQTAAVVTFIVAGAFTLPMIVMCAILLIPFNGMTWIGAKLFHAVDEAFFRRASLIALALVSFGIMVL